MKSPRFLLDTNVCIHIRRRRSPGLLARFQGLGPGEAAISTITFGELVFGVQKSQENKRAQSNLDELINLLPVLPLPPEAGRRYGEIRADLQARGEVIGNNDLWIAAHALSANLSLVTNNTREFNRVAGLRVEDWTI